MTEAGVRQGMRVQLADELRLGLRGQVRRVLAPRGVTIVQRLQIEYRWRYLLVAVEPRTGALRWHWLERFRQDQLKPVLAEWEFDAVIWDGAGAHRGKHLGELSTVRIYLPPYSPELNPVERILEEIRRQVEGRVYATLDDKQAAVEAYLQALAADPERVTRLCGWDWLVAALDHLPDAAPSAAA